MARIAGTTMVNAMAATRRDHGKKTSLGMSASRRAALAAKATASNGKSRFLTMWRTRCATHGNLDETKLINLLAKDERVAMDKDDPIIVMVAAMTRYSIKKLIERACNKRASS